jgi:hypothetical protein
LRRRGFAVGDELDAGVDRAFEVVELERDAEGLVAAEVRLAE